MNRNLDTELAATCGMLHDIFYMSGGGSDNHAIKGAEQAETIWRAMALYSDDEIRIITAAISRHSDKKSVHGPYDRINKKMRMSWIIVYIILRCQSHRRKRNDIII